MDLPIAILLILIGIVIGFSIGALFFALRNEKKETHEPSTIPSPPERHRGAAEISPTAPAEVTPQIASSQPKRTTTGRTYTGLAGIFMRALQAMEVTRPVVELPSITSQIDAILQEQIKGTPLDQRGIRLIEQANQGMAVMIGLERFEDPSTLPDAEVREAIRAAVAEWERRASKSSDAFDQTSLSTPDRENPS